ncbi:DUF3127 domain-containing protein [Capnocytophaga sp. oral taxon 324]|jgi:hypothetical protein|uniref:DUF3127 domain-containing protein n=1 Tax=Capnocytophaga sp. oral taxon 324 TaxID=712211 RepID=UPI0002A2D379|nr:DUF3127 domain-containing protein [Capnocytophaga sp. oral taxon 324]EKY12942.1 hypothetical protein HMPREF9072_01744 [Capnocytophaga sp. oral taxon 324 str. F0483]
MEIQGRVKEIFPLEVIGNNGFQKRDLVITTEEQYPNDISIQFTQGRCALLDNLQKGQLVKVHFNLKGREWISPQGEVKYFNTVEGWKIDLVQMQQVPYNSSQGQFVPAQTQTQATPPPMQQQAPQAQQGEFFNFFGNAPAQSDDNIPF